jgi:putative tryptophan/tyrosine transport system substrate-binding protein
MTRREFIAGLGGAAAAWPLTARAQQKLPVIGWLNGASAQGHAGQLAALRRGLEKGGYVEGRNLAIEYRWADGHYDRLPQLAADLIDRKAAVIVANGNGALAAKALTSTIPIVFALGADPVAFGLVPSLARPGGNLTGAGFLAVELGPKKLELLREVLPGTSTIAALINPRGKSAESQAKGLQQAAPTLGVQQLQILHASTDQEIESAFETLVQLRASGLVVGADPFFGGRTEQLAALSLRYAVPTITTNRDFAAAGGLMSYGASGTDGHELAGVYTGRILNGERPADLPVQLSSKVELVINTKTAKALGIKLPDSLLARADEVIE